MQSTGANLQAALSPDGKLVAVVVPTSSSSLRLRIQIYEISTQSSCSLQQTLTFNGSNDASINDDCVLNQLVFCGSSSLIGLVGDRLIVVWDLTRGVVSETITCQDDDDHRFVDVAAIVGSSSREKAAASNNDQSFCVLVVATGSKKLYVREYLGTKLVRKVKGGRWETEHDGEGENTGKIAALAVSENNIIVRTRQGIRVMQRKTGQKVGKINNVLSTVLRSSIIVCPTDPDILVAVKDDSGSAVLYNCQTCKSLADIPQLEEDAPLSSCLTRLQLIKSSNGESSDYILLFDGILYKIKVGSRSGSYDRVSRVKFSEVPSVLLLTRSDLVALEYRKSGGCASKWFKLDGDDFKPEIQLGKIDSAALPENETGSTSKRKSDKAYTSVLGAGQAGSEHVAVDMGDSVHPSKKAKINAEEDEDAAAKYISIAERLKQFSKAMEEDDQNNFDDDHFDASALSQKTSFVPKKATTESLKEFLTQALQSGDKSLLELALSVRDSKIITQTLNEMEPNLKIILLQKLTARLAARPSRAESLVPWLSYCLRSRGRSPGDGIQANHLSSLRNLLNERTESFVDLLRLEGRLTMLCD